jgi:hypothetical protein
MNHPIAKYLKQHAEPEAANADLLLRSKSAPKQKYTYCLVVPAYDEPKNFLAQLLQNIDCKTDLLIIAVINAPMNEGQSQYDQAAAKRTAKLVNYLKDHESSKDVGSHFDRIIIDRVSPGLEIPAKQGVGLARKIANDLALALYAQGRIVYPWFFQTDADVCLPSDYFITPLPDRGCAIFPHKHVSEDQQLINACRIYDLHMNYYICALKKYGSRYAHPSLGSTFAIHCLDYASVRGYPKRSAGEDFHMLNKLSKIRPLTLLSRPRINVAARQSMRVPFGTGPALIKISALLDKDPSGNSYLSYNYASFQLLGKGLDELNEFVENSGDYKFSLETGSIFRQLGVSKVLPNIANPNLSARQKEKLITQWFDALKTLRFIHLARKFHPDKPLLLTLQTEAADLALLK